MSKALLPHSTGLTSTLSSAILLCTLLVVAFSSKLKAQPSECDRHLDPPVNLNKNMHERMQDRHIDSAVWRQLTLKQQCFLLQLTDISVQNEMDYPPFNYSLNNQPTGFSVDYMKLIANKLGININWVSHKFWRDYIEQFKAGELDVLINIAINKQREPWLNYTERYVQISYAMAVNKSSQLNFKNFDSLNRYRIATVDQTTSGALATKVFKNSTILAYNSLDQAIQAIIDNKADAFVYAGAVIKHHIEKHNLNEINIISAPKFFRANPLNIAIATPKNNPMLRDIFNIAMNNINANKMINLRNKWHIVDSKRTPLGLSEEQESYLSQLKQLTVAGFDNNQPLNFMLDDSPKGYAIDILNNISALLELKIHYQQGEKTSMRQALKDKKVDILLGASPKLASHNPFRFTQPFLTQRNIIVLSKAMTSTRWVHFSQLTDKTIAVIQDSAQHQYLETYYPHYDLIPVNNQQLANNAVSTGKADATIISESQAKYLVFSKQSENLQYQLLNMPNYNTYNTHAIATHKDNTILHSIIEKALAAIPQERLQDIKKQWFNNQIPVNQYESALTYKQRQWLLSNRHLNLYIPNWHLPLGGATPDKYHGVLADLTSYIQQQINYRWLTDDGNSPYISQKTDAQVVVTTADNPQFKHTHVLSKAIHSDPIVMLSNNPEIKLLTSSEQIRHLKLGVFNHPPLPARLFSQYIQTNYESYNDMNRAIEALQNDRLDILFCPMSLCTYYMNQIQDKSIRIVGQTNFNQQIVFAVKRDYAPMVTIINSVLDNMSAQHKNATYQRWNYQSQTSSLNNYREIAKIFIIALIFLIVGLTIIDYFQRIDKAQETEKNAKSIQKSNQALTNAQSKLIAAEKMAALGSLTAGIAHEINNPTNSVHLGVENLEFEIDKIQQFFIDLASEEAEEGLIDNFKAQFAPLFEHVHTIVDGTSRIKTIVEDLRAFTRLDAGEKKQTQVNDIIQSTINLIKAKYKHHTDFITQFTNLPTIPLHSGQLNQVFMNLLVNACDAIEESQQSDTITAPSKRGKIVITTAVQEQQLYIIVQDNGCGMSEQTVKKIFEPFYTTKPVGKGTGLGMAISFGIIDDHGGSMDVCSTINQGTTITIRIPIERRLAHKYTA